MAPLLPFRFSFPSLRIIRRGIVISLRSQIANSLHRVGLLPGGSAHAFKPQWLAFVEPRFPEGRADLAYPEAC